MKKFITFICFAMLCITINSCAVYTVDECYPSRVYYDYYGNVYYRPAPPRHRPAPNHHHHPDPHYSKPSPKPSISQPHHKPNPRPRVPSSRQHNKPNNRR